MGTCAANRGSVPCGGAGPTPKYLPAPGKVLTCAVMAIDLRQELRLTERCPLSFAPWNLYRAMPPCHFDRAEASGEICGALRQTGAREGPFCALCRWLRCARGRLRPVAHRGRSARAIRRVPMCGSLAGAGTMVGEFGEVGYPWERFPVKPGMTGRDWGRWVIVREIGDIGWW